MITELQKLESNLSLRFSYTWFTKTGSYVGMNIHEGYNVMFWREVSLLYLFDNSDKVDSFTTVIVQVQVCPQYLSN